jgi:SAM-dependent methyltransferase
MPIRWTLGKFRILWRDIVMRLSDSTFVIDDLLAGFFFTDTAYQYTWSKLEVHQTLLKDKVRLNAFKKAIGETVKEGDTVLDVGTGTGILAFMAAKAKAKKVIGVDSADIIGVAEKARKKNKLENVKFIRCDVRDLSLKDADVIICELIGMHILDEGIIQKMRIAIKSLKKGGKTMPERIDIFLAPVECSWGIGFWKRISGIDYSFIESVKKDIRNYDLSDAKFLSKPKKVFTIDYANDNFSESGEFIIEEAGVFHGCVMYFEAKLSEKTTLSTNPRNPQTHWKQIFLPNDVRIKVKKGDRINFSIHSCYNNTKWKWKFKKSGLFKT